MRVAQYMLGQCYYNGSGVGKDYARAFACYEKAAEQGNAGAQYMLGQCYYNGNGVEQDYKKAFEWYKKSAEQGNKEAMEMLAKLQ
jgi:TPR repeat protein